MRKAISVVLVVLLLVFGVSVLGCRHHNRDDSYFVNGRYVQFVPQQTYYPQAYSAQQPYYQQQPVYQVRQQPYVYRVPQSRPSYCPPPPPQGYYRSSLTYNPRYWEGRPNINFHGGGYNPNSYNPGAFSGPPNNSFHGGGYNPNSYNPGAFAGRPNNSFHGGGYNPNAYDPRCFERRPCR